MAPNIPTPRGVTPNIPTPRGAPLEQDDFSDEESWLEAIEQWEKSGGILFFTEVAFFFLFFFRNIY